MLARLALLPLALAAGHTIANMPYHRQITEYACGDASMEMVLHRWASPDVDQRAIIDLMRTTWANGTLSYDLVRAGHFSHMSASPTRGLYPAQAPTAGWSPYRPLGMGAFYRRGGECWLQDLRATLDADIPVIVLQYYGPEPSRANGTHFRVVIGYDTTADTFSMHDPWDRPNNGAGSGSGSDANEGDVQPRLYTVSSQEMCALWSYSESNGEQQLGAYFGAALVPWSVTVSYGVEGEALIAISATAEYVCPPGMLCEEPVANNSTLTLSLPPSLALYNGSLTVPVGSMAPGAVVTATWLTVKTDAPLGAPTAITVTAQGIVKAVAPAVAWHAPAYAYTDAIGGVASVPY